VEQYVLSWDTRKLSQAALEALAVIAYRQPVTRAGINAVRGVNSEAVIGSLLEKGLIRDVGRDRMGGNAILYGTTLRFLEKFGLTSLEDLPDIEQFKPVQDVADSIRERLDSTLPATNDQIETLEEDETHEDNDNNYNDDELHETDH
ncbi:MAG: SMC-Scp complex subunit ScpB, partial [Actinomycetia bacterium]|nr:SMC-Scp complex subunit ScpB [Actinomycetes bacterium]